MAFQRIRDPLHNLIEFEDSKFERALWKVIQTEPYQRLRRVKQLGFSELVYPGATHTRFAHSLGVFHTARLLMKIVERASGNNYDPRRAEVALTAALLHDVGHGPFSHAFEAVGKKLNIRMADHENVGDLVIRDGEIADVLKGFGSGFAADVADLIGHRGNQDIYSAVVSSQFDADRLDYMRRDRLMTGTQHGAIDFDWLLSNLEIGDVPTGVDDEPTGTSPTFVLGSKAIYAAETYLLSLFQLYPTVYFHKTTRGAEKLFSEMFFQIVALTRDGGWQSTGLSEDHPIIQFAKEPQQLKNLLALDDTVVVGSLALLRNAKDKCISYLAFALQTRRLFKCVDIREQLRQELKLRASSSTSEAAESDRLDKASAFASRALAQSAALHTDVPSVIVDEGKRRLYKSMQESNGPLEQILIRSGKGTGESLLDVATVSRVVAAVQDFKFIRAYVKRDDKEAERAVQNAIEGGINDAMVA